MIYVKVIDQNNDEIELPVKSGGNETYILESTLVSQFSEACGLKFKSKQSWRALTADKGKIFMPKEENWEKIIYFVVSRQKEAKQKQANIFTGIGSEIIRKMPLYLIFRAVVTNNIQNGKENDPLSPGVLKDPNQNMEILNLSEKIESCRINISSRIFIRSSYQKLLAKLSDENVSCVNILVGTPGIGKSHFGIYFAYTLIQRGIPFVLDTSYSSSDNFFFFKPGGDIILSDREATLSEISQFDKVWYISDGCQPRDLDHKLIKNLYIDTSKMGNVDDYCKKVTNSSRFFLPCWELDEIKTCISKCNIQPIYSNIEELFSIVGGVPRYIFNSNLTRAEDYIDKAILNSNIMKIFDGIKQSIFSEMYSSSLVMPIVNEHLELTNIDFVSRYALTKICIRHKYQILNIIIDKNDLTEIDVAAFKYFALEVFLQGHFKIPYRRLVQGKNTENKGRLQYLKMETNMKKVMFSENTFEEDLKKNGVNNENYKRILLIPRSRKLTIDALILPNMCFQIIKQGKDHAIAATKCFVDLLEKIKNFCLKEKINDGKAEDENRFRFIFVVQDCLFDKFGPQEVKCTEDLSENLINEANKTIEFPNDTLREIEKIMDNSFEKPNDIIKPGDVQNEDTAKDDQKAKTTVRNDLKISPDKLNEIIEISKGNNDQRSRQIQKVNENITQFVISLHDDLYQQLLEKKARNSAKHNFQFYLICLKHQMKDMFTEHEKKKIEWTVEEKIKWLECNLYADVNDYTKQRESIEEILRSCKFYQGTGNDAGDDAGAGGSASFDD